MSLTKSIRQICETAPVIPVLTIDRVADAVPLAQALVAGGLPVLEITLRTKHALEAIREVRSAVPSAITGVGTLRNRQDVENSLAAGAEFGVSPGSPASLLDAVSSSAFPFLPGCSSATEAMTLADNGFDDLKFFPAGAAGGPAMLASLASPLPDISFCPTGGVTLNNASDYLRLPNVTTVGGSWVAPQSLIDARDWPAIEAIAREAVTTLRANGSGSPT